MFNKLKRILSGESEDLDIMETKEVRKKMQVTYRRQYQQLQKRNAKSRENPQTLTPLKLYSYIYLINIRSF